MIYVRDIIEDLKKQEVKNIIPIVTSPSYINRLTSMSNTFNTIIPNVVNKLNQNTEYIQKMIILSLSWVRVFMVRSVRVQKHC